MILPGTSHFPSGEHIPWRVSGCEGKPQAVLQRWRGDWLTANGVWLDPPEFRGPLDKLARVPMKPGAYRLSVQIGDCSAEKKFTVAPFYVVARYDQTRLLISAYRFSDHRPIQNLKFSVLNLNQPVTLGWTGPADDFLIDQPPDGTELRILGPDAEPASVPLARPVASAVRPDLHVFAAQGDDGLHLLFVSMVNRSLFLKNAAGEIFSKVNVEPPFTLLSVSGYRGTSVWIVEEKPFPEKPFRVSAGYPPWVWIPSSDGVPDITSETEVTDPTLTIGWQTTSGQTGTLTFSIADDWRIPRRTSLASLLLHLQEINGLWAETVHGKLYFKWFEDPRDSATISASDEFSGRLFLFSRDAARPLDAAELRESAIRMEPPGAWILKENLSDGVLWVERRYLPFFAAEPWNNPILLDPPIGGSCVRVKIADIGPVVVLITDPDFSPETLTDIRPVNITSTQPVFVSHNPRFLRVPFRTAVFRLVSGVGPGNLRVCLPPSPGVYRLTTLARKAGHLIFRSLTFTIDEGIAHSTRVTEIPDTPYSYRMNARFVNASRSPQDILLRADLPLGFTLQPGEIKEIQRDFWAKPGDRIIAILKNRDALLIDDLLAVESGWNQTFPGVVTRIMTEERKSALAGALAALYEFAVEDGFAMDQPADIPDLEATAIAYLAMKIAAERGHFVDPRRFTLSENWLKENTGLLPEWFSVDGTSPLSFPPPRFPEACTVFPEDYLLWKGETDPAGCPTRPLAFAASADREGTQTHLRVTARYANFPSDHLLIFVETAHCQSPSWFLAGAPARGAFYSNGLAIFVDSRSAASVELRLSCDRGTVGKIYLWAPLEGGIHL